MKPWVTEKILGAIGAADDCVTVAEIAAATEVGRRQVARSCGLLLRRGLVARKRRGRYALTEAGRAALEAGAKLRSGPKGAHEGRPSPRSGTFRERLWRALRLLEKATVPELVTLAAKGDERDPVNSAQRFLRVLDRAGYVVPLKRRAPGTAPTSNGHKRWVLVKNTGPLAPVHRQSRKAVFDPNTGQTISIEESHGAVAADAR